MSSSGFRRSAKIEDMCINRFSQSLKIWQAALAVSGRSSCRVSRYNRRIFTLMKADHKVHIKRGVIVCSAEAVPDNGGKEREKKKRGRAVFFQVFFLRPICKTSGNTKSSVSRNLVFRYLFMKKCQLNSSLSIATQQ